MYMARRVWTYKQTPPDVRVDDHEHPDAQAATIAEHRGRSPLLRCRRGRWSRAGHDRARSSTCTPAALGTTLALWHFTGSGGSDPSHDRWVKHHGGFRLGHSLKNLARKVTRRHLVGQHYTR